MQSDRNNSSFAICLLFISWGGLLRPGVSWGVWVWERELCCWPSSDVAGLVLSYLVWYLSTHWDPQGPSVARLHILFCLACYSLAEWGILLHLQCMCHVLGRLADMGVLVGELQLGELLEVISQHCLQLLSIGVHWVAHSLVCMCVEEEEEGVGMEGEGERCLGCHCD